MNERKYKRMNLCINSFFRSGLNISQALDRARTELTQLPEVTTFLQFIEESGRGVLV